MKGSKPIKREFLRRMIAGIQSSKAKTVALEGTQHKMSDLATMCQHSIDAGVDADAKHVVWSEAVALSRGNDAKLHPILLKLVTHLLTASSPSELEEYGLKPRTRAKTTARTKADAADKALETRAARNTTGTRQKAKAGVVASEDANGSNGAEASTATAAEAATTPSSAAKTTSQTN